MNVGKYLDDMKSIQSEFLEFIENDENFEENFQNLLLILEDKKIRDNKHNLRLCLHHVASVCSNHHRGNNFFGKIERVINILKDEIQRYYLNSEIFSIFKHNKRILLYLIEEKILIFDEYVARKMTNEKYVKKKYPQYFTPEILTFKDEHWFPGHDNELVEAISKDLPDNFHELRKIGENESYICELIRNDNAKDFVAWANQKNFPLDSRVGLSIYETNSFLIKKQNQSGIALIEYAAFFGSMQIVKHMQIEGVKMEPSLWIYAIHSQNAELIHFLEDLHIEPTMIVSKNFQKVEEKSYKECFCESIKCNHNGIADYIFNNYMQKNDQKSNDKAIQSLKYYNFGFLQKKHVKKSSFCRLCEHDYYILVNDLLTNRGVDINSIIIQNNIFQCNSK